MLVKLVLAFGAIQAAAQTNTSTPSNNQTNTPSVAQNYQTLSIGNFLVPSG